MLCSKDTQCKQVCINIKAMFSPITNGHTKHNASHSTSLPGLSAQCKEMHYLNSTDMKAQHSSTKA